MVTRRPDTLKGVAMKRLKLLFFALFILNLILPQSAEALVDIDAVYLTLQNDRDNNGYANFGDTVRVQAVATYTDPVNEVWFIPPFVDCQTPSPGLGMGEYVMDQVDANIGLYQVDIELDEYVNSLNFLNTGVTVRAQTLAAGSVSEPTNTILVDLAQVDGRFPQVSPLVIKNGQNLTIRIEDYRYQLAPYGGTKAWVNLTPIGGGAAVELPYIGHPGGAAPPTAGYFELELDASTQLYLANREYTGALQITLKDPLHPAFIFVTNDFVLDTRPPVINDPQTTVTINRDPTNPNAIARIGDVLRLTATVSQFDNETVWVQIPALTAGTRLVDNTPVNISTPRQMQLISSSGVGNPAVWQLELVLSDADIKSDSMLASFTFIDDATNLRTADRYFRIDLEEPAFAYLNANILYPFGANSPYDVGTTTCQLEIVASVPINAPPDTITVTVDLSPIGGPPAQAMVIGPTTDYRFVYPIVPGATEDNQNLQFLVRAVDTPAGNIVLQSTTPIVKIDNISPTLTNITITSADTTVSTGQTFTISADADFIEAGAVTVDLSSLGLAANAPLTFVSGTLYSGTFTLNASSTAAPWSIPYVEGPRSFVVTARDSVIATNAAVIGHTVTGTTPAKKFFNGNMSVTARVLYPDNTTSPHNVATTTCSIEITATVPTLGFIDPLSLTADFSSIGGPPAQPMPRVGATNQYRSVYTIAPGTTEDTVYNSFTVTMRDKDNDLLALRDAIPMIAVDNVQPNFGAVAILSGQPTIISNENFTITAEVNLIEAGTVTVDLSSIGLAANEPMTLQSGNLYTTTSLVLPVGNGGAIPYVEGPMTFVVTARDTIATTTPGLIAHTITATTPSKKFFNRPISVTSTVLYPDNTTSPYNVATTTCKIMLTADIPTLGFINPLALTADFSPIGGPAAQAMPRVGATNQYQTIYTVPAGTIEDVVYNSFTVDIKDKDGDRLSLIDAIPVIAVDNVSPTFGAITVLSAQPTVVSTETFTITAEVNLIEAGTVTVDLSSLGITPPVQLNLVSGNLYSTGLVELPHGNGTTVPWVEGPMTFVVTARDTIATTTTGLVAHTVTATTPPHKFYNGNLSITANVLYPNDTDSPYDVATTSCKLVISAVVPVNGMITPLTARVDLSAIGGNAAQPMPRVGATNEYRTVYTIPAGTPPMEDSLFHNFTVTVFDKDNTQVVQRDTIPPIGIDNIMPTLTGITLTSAQPTIIAGQDFTITCNATEIENGSVTVNLTPIGFPAEYAVATLTWQSGTTYSGTFTLPPLASAGFVVEGNKILRVSVNDTIATTTTNVFAHLISDFTPAYKFYNRPHEIIINVLSPDDLPTLNDYATATCKLEIIASLSATTVLTPLNVTADLSSIGGPSNLALTKVAGIDNYRGVWQIPAGNLEDDVYRNFPVTILDKDGTQLLKDDTQPPIRIDSKLPIITSAVLTNSDSIINVGDEFTITVNASGIELGSVSVDLSAIDLTYAGPTDYPTMVKLPETSPGSGVFQRSFILKDSITAGIIRDAMTSFRVAVNDTIGNPYVDDAHYVYLNTNELMIDNEPPFIAGIASNSYHNVNVTMDDGHVRIQDYLSLHADIASASQATGELVSITINMLPLGFPANSNMLASASNPGWFDYIVPSVATGTINRVNTAFTVTAVDNANNATSTIIYIPIDNQPLTISDFLIDASVYKPGRIDSVIGTINFNKIVDFKIPYSTFPVDHSTGTIDLTAIGGPGNALMASDTASYSYVFPTASTTFEALGHQFRAMLYDLAGNSTAAISNAYTVDCQLPTILEAKASPYTGTEPLGVGDKILFEARVQNHENTQPRIDLSTIAGNANQAMNLISTGYYAYVAEIGTGTWDIPPGPYTPASFPITAYDNDGNYVSSFTNELDIDNSPPVLSEILQITTADDPIRVGTLATFTLVIASATPAWTVTLDLAPMGGSVAQVMNYEDVTKTFSYMATGLQATAEYPNHVFKATVVDAGSNIAIAESVARSVDCQPITFSLSGIIISQTNGDNPVATVANLNDVLTVYASASAYVDANTIQATIGSGTTDFATATLVFNAVANRHEAQFTVSAPGVGGWGINNGNNLYYKLTGLDDAGNVSPMVQGNSTFTVRNQRPTMVAATTLNPDYNLPNPIYNLGTSTVGDLLFATAYLENDTTMNRAWLDFSACGSGTVQLTVNGSSAATLSGIAVSRLPAINGESREIYLVGQDEGGNKDFATFTFTIDNVAPQVVSAQFNGSDITVNLSETYNNLQIGQWTLVGSNTLPAGTPAYLNFPSGETVTQNATDFVISLSQAQQITVGGWASTPVYLQISNSGNSPLTDMNGNELRPVTYYPVTITDSSWRELPKVSQVAMTQYWPNQTVIDIYFNKNVVTTTLNASAGVLLVKNLAYPYSTVDYSDGYVFQHTLDNFAWQAANHLRVTLSPEGSDWVARKLTNSGGSLRFATRTGMPNNASFVKDNLDRGLVAIPSTNPIVATDNRPVPDFNFAAVTPELDMASRSLKLVSTDRLLLFTNDFGTTNVADPLMAMPVPLLSRRVTGFHNKIILHETDSGASVVLQLEDLQLPTDGLYASTTITLKLTMTDVDNVINLFQSSATPVWKLQIQAGAFTNIWGLNNIQYLPSGQPGNLTMIYPSGYNPVTVAACSMSDKPPVNQKTVGGLTFEVELFPSDLDGAPVPIQTNVVPTAEIKRQDNDALICSGNFVSFTNRTVAGKVRTVARFTNASTLPVDLQRIPAYIEVAGIRDIFDVIYSVTASQAYDLSLKNDSAPDGFTDPASTTIEIDTFKPSVIRAIPEDYIGRLPAGSDFRVEFSEAMDPLAIPTLQLATGTTTMNFTFNSWVSPEIARFSNNTAFTPLTLNGTWTWQVSGGRDEAGNNFDGTFTDEVQVRTFAPDVAAGNVHVRTVQTTIDATVRVDEPWSQSVGNAEFSLLYTVFPTQYLPHYIEIYDDNNIRYGRATVSAVSPYNTATATFGPGNFDIDPGMTGPTVYRVRVVDSAMNRTESLLDLVYDNLGPDVSNFSLSGVASQTATTSYYNPMTGNFTANVTTSSTSDELRLAVYSHNANATSTYLMTQSPAQVYSVSTGNLLTNGTYTLTIVDLAGNIGTGAAIRTLVVDNMPPTVLAVNPSGLIGNSPIGGTTFSVVFAEMMDASPALAPTLTLATSTATITMTFVGWHDPLVATTAYFTNAVEIASSMPTGFYNYSVSGGRDLAGNNLLAPSAGSFKVEIQTKGPFAVIDVQTTQPHIYTTTPPNLSWNPAFGPATFNLDYAAGPFNTPHSLEFYDSGDTLVETLPIPPTDPASINYPATPLTTGVYRFKIRDAANNVSGSYLPNPFYIDIDAPVISNPIAVISNGIASDTGAGLINFYSPTAGNANFIATTTANEELIMIIKDISNATSTVQMVGSATTHSVSYGSSLADGGYDILFVDKAGNLATGAASSARLIVDSVAPSVTAVVPTLAGGLPAGTGIFDFSFDSHMNTQAAVVPVAYIATQGVRINLSFQQWLDANTCRFTNVSNLETYPTGKYSYFITGSRDLAGNLNTDLATGTFEIDLFTSSPAVTATLRSEQTLLSGNTVLLNRPFSINALPGIADLSLAYSQGPFQVPHEMRIYDSNSNLVNTVTVNPDVANMIATVTVDAAFFGSPGNIGPADYRFRLVDSIGNLSATNTRVITYDALAPVLDTVSVSPISDGSNNPLYYNETIHGPLTVRFGSTATDSLLLVAANGTATATWAMTLNDPADQYSTTLSTAQAATLATGTYVLTAVDLAGNFGTGAASTTVLVIDRDLPQVTAVVSLNGDPLTSEPAGGATFTVTFNEPMKASATPVLRLATATTTINCVFDSWLSANQARFVTSQAITPDMPQGLYNYQVTATDLTGNVLNNAVVGTVSIRSRGPIIASIYAESQQMTTASGTEILRDAPFSFNVAPGAATLTVQLAQAPDTLPVYLHFMQTDITVASYALTLSGQAATFTWSVGNGPNPAFPTTYQVKLVDNSGDFSLESYNWTMDASEPIALDHPKVTRGELGTGTVYFNPSRHGYVGVEFNAIESQAPKMRVRGVNSTDTYALGAAGSNKWSGNFDGRFSRGASPRPLMPDGIYILDLVDHAGNVGILASGDPILYNIVIDTVAPGVSTYSTLVAGNPVTAFSPAAGNLEVRVVSPDPLSETGVYWMEVLNSSNIRINRLPVSNSGGNYSAFWDGRNSGGSMVLDGNYSFRATDYAGNPATGSVGIFALTTPFKVVGCEQISSSTAKIIFNHEVDPSLGGAAIAATGLTISSISRIEPQAVSFSVAPQFTHQTAYTFTITPGSIRSVYGAGIDAPYNTASLQADGQGPKLVEVNFSGLSGQQEFKVVFDESYSQATAGNLGNYSLTGPSGAVGLAAATTQADTRTVLLTATANLVENVDYQISVTGIEDIYGNLSPAGNSLAFKGRDLTPPVLEVSAFSNPANENDLIVVVVANEDLQAPPVLQVAQSNAPVVTTSMQQGANARSFMIGVHLSTSYPGNGTLVATGKDIAGNQGSGNTTFAVAYVSASKVVSVKSADEALLAEFSIDSLKEDATLKILNHRLEKLQDAGGEVRTALQRQARVAMGLRASSQQQNINHSELVPVGMAYEVAIEASKIKEGFNVFVELPATATPGLGLFYQNGDEWKFLTASRTRGNKFAAKLTNSQMFAILQDTKAPEVKLAADINLAEPFRTARPEFRGQIVETGSGLDMTTISAHIDNGPAQAISVDANGNFTFRPQADLTGGRHDLLIKASDKTGNAAALVPLRFEVVVPLQITQIAQYPNPARVRTFIRISANRGDINEDLVRVRIYDVSGHKVATLDGIRPVNEKWGINARFVYDIPWDLRNSGGKNVANGVYFARIEVRDPDDPSKKVKETFKIAILR